MRAALALVAAGALLLDTGVRAGRAASTAGAGATTSLRGDEATGTVVVLTMNRPESLKKLLASLCSANYGGEKVDLRVEVDATKHDGPDQPTLDLLKDFEWPFGEKTVNARDKNVGLARSWIDFAWPDPEKDSGLHVILEDDVTVSPVFWAWLRKDMRSAATRRDVAGLSLQKPTMNATDGKVLERIGPLNEPFLYQLVGSIGFAPRAQVWRDFREWHREALDKPIDGKPIDPTQGKVAGLVTSKWYKQLAKDGRTGSMWSQWFVKFCADRGLYTLYQNPLNGTALASHWRMPGEHSGGAGRDFAESASADVAMGDFNFAHLRKYDFAARPWRESVGHAAAAVPAKAPLSPVAPLPAVAPLSFLQSSNAHKAGASSDARAPALRRLAAVKRSESWAPTAQELSAPEVNGLEDPRLQQYLGPKAAQDVSAALQRLRKSASRAVIASFTVEMREMAENFLCSAAAAKEPNTGILMVGLYEGACQNFPTHGAECLAIVPKGTPPGNSTMDVVYKSQKYLHSVLVKHVVFTLAVSSSYFNWLLLSDVDVMLLGPSFAYIDEQGNRLVGDFAFMRGNAAPTSVSKLNSGFYYVRSTPKSRQIMWKSLDNLFNGQTYDGGDQGALAKAIADAGVVPNYLPSSLYPNGAILVRHPQSLAPAPRAFHLNYIKTKSEKIRCMKAAHCWSRKPDGTCSVTCSAQQVRQFRCTLEGALFLEENDDAIFF